MALRLLLITLDGMLIKEVLILCFLGTGSESLHVSHILQKAKIEVSEDGTKASAATSKCWLTWQGHANRKADTLQVHSAAQLTSRES